ncbi:MAG: hypothetical protein ABIP97_08710 [Chthoniobacterales bacterium]
MATVTEAQVQLARACAASALLQEWMEILADMPPELRKNRITHMASQMARDKETPALVDAVESLNDPAIFAGVQEVLAK